MSGSFTQTGNISTLDKFTKAAIATQYGVDLVIELPTIYATSSSEYFATGAISLLNELGIVDCICFGSECSDIQILNSISTKLIQNENSIWEDIKLQGKNDTFAKTRSNVLSKYLNEDEIKEIAKPNNILGIEYLKALKKLNSNITPYLIQRSSSDYNDSTVSQNELNFTSATSIRNAIKNNDIESIRKYIPTLIYDKLITSNILLNNDIYNILKYKIISMTNSQISDIHEVTEGIENRLIKCISIAKSYDELVDIMKSKRYIENKIKRVLINVLLQIDKENFKNIALLKSNYAHILAMSSNGSTLLSNISRLSKMPVFTSINDDIISTLDNSIKYMINLNIYSSNIHNLLTNTNLNKDFTNKL